MAATSTGQASPLTVEPDDLARPAAARQAWRRNSFQMAHTHATGTGSGGCADGRMAAFTRSGAPRLPAAQDRGAVASYDGTRLRSSTPARAMLARRACAALAAPAGRRRMP